MPPQPRNGPSPRTPTPLAALASVQVHATAAWHEEGTGLAPEQRWDLAADRQALQEEASLQVGRPRPCNARMQ